MVEINKREYQTVIPEALSHILRYRPVGDVDRGSMES